MVNDLFICQSYWVTTTAINCGSNVRSQPAYVDVNDPMTFDVSIDLASNGPCLQWIIIDREQKNRDVQNFFVEVLNDVCGLVVSCVANNTFTCEANDMNKVDIR